MTKVVLDTNVLVSALLTTQGANAAVLDLIMNGKLVWCVSEPVLAEYETVLHRSKFQGIERRKIALALALARSGRMTIVTTTLSHSPHESDNRFYECAGAARADYLVTGNRKHFPNDIPPTRIVTSRQLLDLIRA